MAIRLSGMVSGLDTDSVVQALMSAQKYKKTKIEASKQKLEWKQELWSDMNTKIYDF
ncbi:MAG: flagellar cap protein, partial [Lachnospiraceae bacterium]|nr:flagellar cap protein [Lachnospiraceae bacterium]